MSLDAVAPLGRPFPERVLRSIWAEKWIFVLTVIVLSGSAALMIRKIPKVYESTAEVLIQSSRSQEELVSAAAPSGVGQLEAVGTRVNPINNQVALITSSPIFNRALNLAKIAPAEAPIDSLSAKPISEADLIMISYRSDTPELAQKVVKGIVSVYSQDNLLYNRQKATAARQFLEKSLPKLKRDLEIAQDRLAQFQTRNRFVGTDVEKAEISRSLSAMLTKANEAQAELVFTQRKIQGLKEQLPGDLSAALKTAGLGKDPNYQALQTQLIQAETELAGLQSRYTDQAAQVKSAKDKRDQLKALLQTVSVSIAGSAPTVALDPVRQGLVEKWFDLDVDRQAQSARLQQLQQQLNQASGRNDQMPELVKQQTRLQAEVDKAQQNYVAFAEKYTTSQIIEQQSLGNVRVVEPASLNPDPVAPRTSLMYALALILSTGAGLGVVWLRRVTNNRLEGTAALAEILPLPILATVPLNGRLLRPDPQPDSLLLNSYQLLQAHLRMLPRTVQVIGLCSWSAAEGGSVVSENLALLEAQTGRRVLLIDTNSNDVGIPKFRKFSFADQMEPEPTRSAQPGRKEPHSPADDFRDFHILSYPILSSMVFYKKWSILLEKVRKHYDLIIIDSPPVSLGSEATLLASLADGIVWVVSPDELGRRGVEAASETLRTWNTRLLGQVIVGGSAPAQMSAPLDPRGPSVLARQGQR